MAAPENMLFLEKLRSWLRRDELRERGRSRPEAGHEDHQWASVGSGRREGEQEGMEKTLPCAHGMARR